MIVPIMIGLVLTCIIFSLGFVAGAIWFSMATMNKYLKTFTVQDIADIINQWDGFAEYELASALHDKIKGIA